MMLMEAAVADMEMVAEVATEEDTTKTEATVATDTTTATVGVVDMATVVDTDIKAKAKAAHSKITCHVTHPTASMSQE